MQKAIALLLCLCPITLSATERAACPIPGHAIQWIADYCMYKEQTDDLVAAGACMEREQARSTLDECATKRWYKTKLCKRHIANRTRKGSLATCVGDIGFSGNIVHSDGAR